jgi:4-amino-4-deoxy-L-arabinose transferase-like glycosyltransferase
LQIADGRGFGVRISRSWLSQPRAEAGERLLPCVVLFAAVALRVVPLLARYPLHRDEALYGAWAQLIARGVDPLLLTAWVDKPPLVIYLLAASLRSFGATELALRLPGMIASVVCVALVYAGARDVYGRRPAMLAAILCAASPFAILFAPTAFTDPWLTVWLLASAWAALAGKPFWAGILLGLAVASKQQGVLAAPLVLALMAAQSAENAKPESRTARLRTFLLRRFLPALAGFTVIFVPLTYWDSLRWAKRPSFWGRSLDTYGGLRLARPEELLPRLGAWVHPTGYLYGRGYVTAFFLALGLLPGALAIRQHYAKKRARLSFAQRVDLILSSYVLGYMALHVLVTFQPWDRYLLPILPLVAILTARGLFAVGRGLEGAGGRAAAAQPLLWLSVAVLLAWGSWIGASGGLPVGSDHGAFDNLDRVVAFVRGRPSDALIYHHSLGWYFDFYLSDTPQERIWWEDSWKLADLASQNARRDIPREQWLVLTGSEEGSAKEIAAVLSGWGLTLRDEQVIQRRDQTLAFTVHGIGPEKSAGPWAAGEHAIP